MSALHQRMVCLGKIERETKVDKFVGVKLNTYRVTFEVGSVLVKSFCKRMAGHRARAVRDAGKNKTPVSGAVIGVEKLEVGK